MLDFIGKTVKFVTALSKDPRIPARDKAVLAGFLAILVSPVDVVPDFIPVLGQLDDVLITLIVLDYVFNRIPDRVLFSHYPWNPVRLQWMRRRMRFLSRVVPGWVRDLIWKSQEKAVNGEEVSLEQAQA